MFLKFYIYIYIVYIYVVYILYILYIYTYVCIYIHMYIQISSICIFKYINQPETGIDCYMIKNYYSKQWWIQLHFLKMLWGTMQCPITLSLFLSLSLSLSLSHSLSLSCVKYSLQKNILNEIESEKKSHIISVVLTSDNNFSGATCKKMSSKLSSWIIR